jgi:protoporphyrinogen oxidase
MKSARRGAKQKELVGHLIGGHITLIKAMAEVIEEAGGMIHLGCPVQEIMIENGTAWGLRFGNRAIPFDALVATMQVPLFRRLIPDADPAYHEFLAKTEYVGIISPLLVLDHPLSGYWTMNITDNRFPFTGVIETTTYIDPQFVGGHHLVYLPRYTAPGSRWQQVSDDEIRRIWLQELEAMFPSFDRSWIRYFLVHREAYAEPLHRLNGTDLIPSVKTPIENLYLATTAQIYPDLTNAESVSRHARRAAQVILEERTEEDLSSTRQLAREMANDRVLV